MQTISAAVIKGGTGKSTTIAALAQAAADEGKRVLAIDLDPQGNLSAFVGADQSAPGSYQLLHGADASQLIQGTAQGIDAISASPDLATEKTTPGSARRLLKALEPIKEGYDLCVIDTPPQMAEVTYNALFASTGVIIPLETDTSSIQGLYQIAEIIRQIQRQAPALEITGVILTRYDSRPKLNRHLRGVIIDRCKELSIPFLAEIRPGIAIREAQATQQSIFAYAPKSKPAQDYKTLFNMIQGV